MIDIEPILHCFLLGYEFQAWYYPIPKLLRIYMNRQEYDTIFLETGKSIYDKQLVKTLFEEYRAEART